MAMTLELIHFAHKLIKLHVRSDMKTLWDYSLNEPLAALKNVFLNMFTCTFRSIQKNESSQLKELQLKKS